jgi:hypothetical protein
LKVVGSPQTLLIFYQIALGHFAENNNLHSQSCEKLKPLNAKVPPVHGKQAVKAYRLLRH